MIYFVDVATGSKHFDRIRQHSVQPTVMDLKGLEQVSIDCLNSLDDRLTKQQAGRWQIALETCDHV